MARNCGIVFIERVSVLGLRKNRGGRGFRVQGLLSCCKKLHGVSSLIIRIGFFFFWGGVLTIIIV